MCSRGSSTFQQEKMASVPESDLVMSSNTNSLSTVTERNRASAALSSSASATIDDASATYFMAPVRGSNPDEQADNIGSNQSDETEQLHGTRDDAVTESCKRKESFIYNELKEYTEPTFCTQDCNPTMIVNQDCKPRTISDYKAAIRHHLERLRTHSEAKNAAVWTRKELDEDGKGQKKKSYQKKEPKVTGGADTAAAKKKKDYWEGKESMDKMDEELEKLYDDLPELLDELQKWISKESYLYHLLSTRKQFWPSIRSLSGDPIIDELKKIIADKVGTQNLADKKQIANRHGSILFRCKNKMFQNCFKAFHFHGKELKDLINKLLVLMEEEVEPLQAKRKRLSGEEEFQNEVMSNLKKVAHPVQSTRLLVEDILEAEVDQYLLKFLVVFRGTMFSELEMRLSSSSNLVPLTYEQLKQALGQDIRPILRKFLMDSTQTVENTVKELVQLSNNQFILYCTSDRAFPLAALGHPTVWSAIIFNWLAERRISLIAAMPIAKMKEPQDEDLQITSYDDGSICKTPDTPTANVCRLEPEEESDDDSLLDYRIYSPTGVQKNSTDDLSLINPTISPLPINEWKELYVNIHRDIPSCSNGTTSPLTKEADGN